MDNIQVRANLDIDGCQLTHAFMPRSICFPGAPIQGTAVVPSQAVGIIPVHGLAPLLLPEIHLLCPLDLETPPAVPAAAADGRKVGKKRYSPVHLSGHILSAVNRDLEPRPGRKIGMLYSVFEMNQPHTCQVVKWIHLAACFFTFPVWYIPWKWKFLLAGDHAGDRLHPDGHPALSACFLISAAEDPVFRSQQVLILKPPILSAFGHPPPVSQHPFEGGGPEFCFLVSIPQKHGRGYLTGQLHPFPLVESGNIHNTPLSIQIVFHPSPSYVLCAPLSSPRPSYISYGHQWIFFEKKTIPWKFFPGRPVPGPGATMFQRHLLWPGSRQM